MARLGRAQPIRHTAAGAVYSPVTVGPYYPLTAANVVLGGEAWSSIQNIKALDTNLVGGSNSFGSSSDYLVCSNFGFNISRNRSVTGIKVELLVLSAFSVTPVTVRLQKDNALGPRVPLRRLDTIDDWPAGHTFTFGGPFDTFSEPYLPAEINSQEFGCSISLEATDAGRSVQLDAARMTIYTTDTVLPTTTYAAGTYNFGPTAITGGNSMLTFWVDTTLHTDADVSFTLDTEISYDNGSTWNGFMTGSRTGTSTPFHPSGSEDFRFVMFRNLADSGSNTQFRGSFTVSGGSLLTGVGVFVG